MTDEEAWMAAWRKGMRRRGYRKARIGLWKGSYSFVTSVYPFDDLDGCRCRSPWYVFEDEPTCRCLDDAYAVFLSIEHLRPSWVRPRPSLRKLLAQSA